MTFEPCDKCKKDTDVRLLNQWEFNTWICPECVLMESKRCDACNKRLHFENGDYLKNDDYLCDDCLNALAYKCDMCEEYDYKDNMTSYDQDILCDDCRLDLIEKGRGWI